MMVHVGERVKALIEKKVRQINEDLENGADGLPPISVSVGVALCRTKGSVQDMSREADIALYHVKNNGRRGCAFYHEDMRTYKNDRQ